MSLTDPQLTYVIARSTPVDDVPGDSRPMQDSGFQPPATAEWLALQAAAGRIPEPDDPSPELRLTVTSRLLLTRADASSDGPACSALTAPLTVSLRAGDQFRFVGTIEARVTDGTHQSRPRRFAALEPSIVLAQAGRVAVVVRKVLDAPAWVCPRA